MNENLTEKTEVRGLLDKIIYQNDNGFLIASFLSDGGAITALGTLINPQVDLDYQLTGEWSETSTHGKQFKFSGHRTMLPQDPNGIFKYIVRICKYVGVEVGNDLVNRYKGETLNVLRLDPDRVSKETKGLTLARAEEIRKSLIDNQKNEQVQVDLEALLDVPGMRKALVKELIDEYRDNAPAKIKENPYILTDFHRVGFLMADKVAVLKVGIARDHVKRKMAATLHCIKENMQEGNVWILKAELITKITDLIQVSEPDAGIKELLKKGKIVKKRGAYATTKASKDEEAIAKFLIGGVNVTYA